MYRNMSGFTAGVQVSRRILFCKTAEIRHGVTFTALIHFDIGDFHRCQ
jgi:hypothetical protein